MAANTRRVEGTREAILAILRRRSRISVDEFTAELDLAGATVRRHLDVLLRDGSISVEQDRGGTGRPRYVFSLTEHGADLVPHHYVRLTRRLVEEIVGLGGADTAGRDGATIAGVVFDRMSERLWDRYGTQVHGADIAERARQAVDLLAAEGMVFEVLDEPDGLTLLGRGCPCQRSAAGGYGCEHDRSLFERLLGAPVAAIGPDHLPSSFLGGYRVVAGS